MGLDEMYCVDKRFMDGYGGCTDVLMCTQCPDVHPNGPRGSERGQNALLVSRVNGIFGSLVVSAALASVFFFASILQRWNIWIFLPATRLRRAPRQKASPRGPASGFWGQNLRLDDPVAVLYFELIDSLCSSSAMQHYAKKLQKLLQNFQKKKT